MVLADYLTEHGYRVVEASNADEAVKMLEQETKVMAVVTDVRMPGTIDGLALARMIETRWSHVKVIITSGYLGSETDQVPPEAAFIRKPYQPEAIASLLRSELA